MKERMNKITNGGHVNQRRKGRNGFIDKFSLEWLDDTRVFVVFARGLP